VDSFTKFDRLGDEVANQIDALAVALRSVWTRGSIQLNCWPNGDCSVYLHLDHGHGCVVEFGDTASETVNKALAAADREWPDDATIAAKVLAKAQAELAKAQAAVDAIAAHTPAAVESACEMEQAA
jgi:hypothetical protein